MMLSVCIDRSSWVYHVNHLSVLIYSQVDVATWRRTTRGRDVDTPQARAERETENVIEQLLEQEGCTGEPSRADDKQSGGPVALVAKTASLVYSATMIVPRAARWLLGYGSSKPPEKKE